MNSHQPARQSAAEAFCVFGSRRRARGSTAVEEHKRIEKKEYGIKRWESTDTTALQRSSQYFPASKEPPSVERRPANGDEL